MPQVSQKWLQSGSEWVEPAQPLRRDGAGLPVTVLVCAPVAVGAAVRFNMAGIVGADALVRALPVGHPSAPIVVQRIAGDEGRFIRRALGTQAAEGAGLVVDRLFRAGCGGLQILRLCFFSREAMRLQRAVGLTAVVAHGLLRAGRRAAGMLAEGDILGNAEAVAPPPSWAEAINRKPVSSAM